MARQQWTMKGRAADPELRLLVAKAAKLAGYVNVSDYIADVLTERSQQVIKARNAGPEDGPPAGPPPAMAQPVDLAAEFAMLRQQQEVALARIEQRSRIGRWRRR